MLAKRCSCHERGDAAQLLRRRYVAQPDRWRWLHTAHGVRAINYLARNRGGEYFNTLRARTNPQATLDGGICHSSHDISRWLAHLFSHLPHTISTAGLLQRLRRLTFIIVSHRWHCIGISTFICTTCQRAIVSSCHISSPKLSLMVIHCRLFLLICQGVCWVIDRMRSRYRDIYLRHITLTQFLVIHPLPQKDPAHKVNTKTHLPIEYKQRSVRFWQGQEYSHRTVVKPKVAFCRKIPHSSLSAHGIMAIR